MKLLRVGEIGNELFYYLFKGEPAPKNGFIDLDDNIPGLGISINEKYKSDFKIVSNFKLSELKSLICELKSLTLLFLSNIAGLSFPISPTLNNFI